MVLRQECLNTEKRLALINTGKLNTAQNCSFIQDLCWLTHEHYLPPNHQTIMLLHEYLKNRKRLALINFQLYGKLE